MNFERWVIVFLAVVIGVLLYIFLPTHPEQSARPAEDSLRFVIHDLQVKLKDDSVKELGKIANVERLAKIIVQKDSNIAKLKRDESKNIFDIIHADANGTLRIWTRNVSVPDSL